MNTPSEAVERGTSRCSLSLSPADFKNDQLVRWCPGCGDYSILAQVQKVLPKLGIPRENFVFVSGIGCSSRFPYYLNTYGIHGIHGRAPAIATGVKCANPDLSVWVVMGDGDGFSIGTNHTFHALRRNIDINILLFNNRIYGLTKGQYSPTSEFGKRTKSSPYGTIEQPVSPVRVAIAAGATFIARSVAADPRHLESVLEAAARHRGTSFVEILQNCVVFNDGAFRPISARDVRDDHRILLEDGKPILFGKDRRKGIGICNMQPCIIDLDAGGKLEDILIHDIRAESPALPAMLAALEPPNFPTALGVFRDIDKPTYNDLLFEQIADVRKKKGLGDLNSLLNSGSVWEV